MNLLLSFFMNFFSPPTLPLPRIRLWIYRAQLFNEWLNGPGQRGRVFSKDGD